jgi:hypothetical protein
VPFQVRLCGGVGEVSSLRREYEVQAILLFGRLSRLPAPAR